MVNGSDVNDMLKFYHINYYFVICIVYIAIIQKPVPLHG